ncbi:MAG TPA: hypothetical protein VLR46_00850, partial [Candidatus Dormibacteraeota bacterium]|nr:hypothetical protein [Candidatus Dormibacteraeota bacterium]
MAAPFRFFSDRIAHKMRTPAMRSDPKRAVTTRRRQNRQIAEPPEVLPPEQAGAEDELQAKSSRLESLFTEGRYEHTITLGESILELLTSAQSRGGVLLFLAISNFQLARIQ